MRKLRLDHKPIDEKSINNDFENNLGLESIMNSEKLKRIQNILELKEQNNINLNSNIQPNEQNNSETGDNNNSEKNRISIENFIKKTESDKFTILKIIIMLLFIIVAVFTMYHVFFGENGIESQKEKAEELGKLEYIKAVKEHQYRTKKTELEKLKKRDMKTIEEEARKKGYIYPDEIEYKIINDDKISNNKKNNKNDDMPIEDDYKTQNNFDASIYLILSVIGTLIILIVSYIVNVKQLKKMSKE